MHGLVERQGLKQEHSWRVEPESRAIGATFVCRSLVSETGLACMRVEVECGRVVPLGNPSQDNWVLAPRPRWCELNESCT